MRILKEEEVDASAYRDAEHARARIGQFIETVYNRQRLHCALGYLTPEEYEATLPPSHRGRAPDAMASTNETCPCF